LDQYLGIEKLEELILEEGNVFDDYLPLMTSLVDVFDSFLNILNFILLCHLQPFGIKNATLTGKQSPTPLLLSYKTFNPSSNSDLLQMHVFECYMTHACS
jgi:hypothetical protein